jgi:hypothetical protein
VKIALFILTFTVVLFRLNAQEFSFQLFFEDAVGNKDTIILGYDSSATNAIDINFEEKNIISEKIEKPFEVRISDEWRTRGFQGKPGSWHSKKQIINSHCWSYWDEIQGIDIFSNHWPVTMRWDTSLFNTDCREGSLITCIHPGGWWDVSCPSDLDVQLFILDGIKSFNANLDKTGYAWWYINMFNDTITYYFLAIGGEGIFHVDVKDEFKTTGQIKVNPNPVAEIFSLHIPENFGKLKSLQLFSITGKILIEENKSEDIDVNHLSPGFYFINTTFDSGKTAIAKFIKR